MQQRLQPVAWAQKTNNALFELVSLIYTVQCLLQMASDYTKWIDFNF